MKKLLFLLIFGSALSVAATAQAKAKEETKVKKTSTVGQKVHNTFSKHKKYKGHKVKHKVENGKG
jgi:hypothetical protein